MLGLLVGDELGEAFPDAFGEVVAEGVLLGVGVAVIVRGTGDLSANCTSTGSDPKDAATTW